MAIEYESAEYHLDKLSQQDQGSFYTPEEIALKMAKTLNLTKKGKILDPCCGKGNLFVAILETYSFIEESDLYGVDIDPEAIKFCIQKFPKGNFRCGDVLKDSITSDHFWLKRDYDTQTYEEYCNKHSSPFLFGLKI